MNLKKKTKVMLFLLSIIAITIISAILAYLTDKATRENEFTIGNIDIELVESKWENLTSAEDTNNNGIPDVAEAVAPGQSIEKDPLVKNVGDNPAYVYLRVEVPKAEVSVDGGEKTLQPLFTYNPNTINWEPMENLTVEKADSIIYTYHYKNSEGDVLPAKTDSENLFASVKLVNITDFSDFEADDLTKQIVVKAYAIQTGDELTVDNNKWTKQFENEKNGGPVQLGVVMLNEKETYTVGEKLEVGIIVDKKAVDKAGNELTENTAPKVQGRLAEGEIEDLHFEGEESYVGEQTANAIEKIAVSSRAKSNIIRGYVLKYSYTIKPNEEEGKLKIINIIGAVYSENGIPLYLEAPDTMGFQDVSIKKGFDTYKAGEKVTIETLNGLEDFYVIENSGLEDENLKLITALGLDSDLKQSTTPSQIIFSTNYYWEDIPESSYKIVLNLDTNSDDYKYYDLNDYVPNDLSQIKSTDATEVAKRYAEEKVQKGAKGRLLSVSECASIIKNESILISCETWINASGWDCGDEKCSNVGCFDSRINFCDYTNRIAVLPVIEISKLQIRNKTDNDIEYFAGEMLTLQTANGKEDFGVIENCTKSQKTVKLITKYCLNDQLEQEEIAYHETRCKFSENAYWEGISTSDLKTFEHTSNYKYFELNDYVPSDLSLITENDVIEKAKRYAISKISEDAKGRLLSAAEYDQYRLKNGVIINHYNQSYWMGFTGSYKYYYDSDWYQQIVYTSSYAASRNEGSYGSECAGVRPVIEIPKTTLERLKTEKEKIYYPYDKVLIETNNGNEYFYVIEKSRENNAKVKLISACGLDNNLKQSASPKNIAFSGNTYWKEIPATDYQSITIGGTARKYYDLNDYIPTDPSKKLSTDAIEIAKRYANEKVQKGAIGRLMNLEEYNYLLDCDDLNPNWDSWNYDNMLYYYYDIENGDYGKMNYWLSSANTNTSNNIWKITGSNSTPLGTTSYSTTNTHCVRPVIEILKSEIEN